MTVAEFLDLCKTCSPWCKNKTWPGGFNTSTRTCPFSRLVELKKNLLISSRNHRPVIPNFQDCRLLSLDSVTRPESFLWLESFEDLLDVPWKCLRGEHETRTWEGDPFDVNNPTDYDIGTLPTKTSDPKQSSDNVSLVNFRFNTITIPHKPRGEEKDTGR